MLNKRSEKGQAIIIIIFAIIGLIALTGLTVDGGMAFSDRRQAQGAVDSAAWAAALAKTRGQDITLAAKDIANQNGYVNDGTHSVVTVTITASPSGVCPAAGQDIKVDITSHVNTFFAPVIGVKQVTNAVTASTRACDVSGTTPTQPLYAGNAIYSTRTTACGNGVNDKAIYTGGSSQIQLWGAGFGDSSTDPDCMHFPGGNVQLKKAESGTACANLNSAAPNGIGVNYSSISPQNGCGIKNYNVPVVAPPADLHITCAGNATKTGSSLSPGNYTGTFPPSGVSTLQPGTYCVNGDFTLNGNANLSGNGVTIVMNTGGIKWNGSMTLNLSAPTSGTYKGLVIYAPPGNTSQMKMNGSSNVTLVGTMLAQNAPCDFVGSGQIQKVELQMICYTWQMNGNADVQIMYTASKLFIPPPTLIMPSISLIK